MKNGKYLLLALALTLPLAGVMAQTTNKVPVTAGMLSASSVYNGYTPITAFDGSLAQNSGWSAVGGDRQGWLVVDFVTPKHVAYARVIPDRYIANNPSYSYLDRFRVEVWSNAVWQAVTPLISTPEETWYPAPVNFTTTKLRFWCESDGNGPQVKEIEIYEVVWPPPPPVAFTPNSFAVGDEDSGPDGLATADVNGDGRLDLISANYGFRWALPGDPGGWSTNVVVLTNNGSGGFAWNATLSVGAGPASVVAVDVNGDGWPDVISANQSANTLTVLTNSGSGFGLSLTLTASGSPSSLVAADVNGDWTLDLAYVSSGANTVTTLTNNGRGLFTAQGTFPVGARPIFLVTTDVNGDARPDLISVNHEANSLSVLTNNGSGFGLNTTLPVGNIPVAAAAGDLNRDGAPDLVSVNWGDNTLTVLTNNGTGVFGLSATLPVGVTPSSVAVGDFNGDGAADLICANTSAGAGNSLTVYTNSGSGSFGVQATLTLGNIPTALLAADVNSDGRLDANFLNFRDGTLTVLLNTTLFPPATSSRALTISRQGDAVQVAWPSASPGWSLQQKRDLNAPNWLPSGHDGYPFADNRTHQSLTLPPANAGLFFRLLHP